MPADDDERRPGSGGVPQSADALVDFQNTRTEQCSVCRAPAIRTIVQRAYCFDCAEEILAPIRARHGVPAIGRGLLSGRPRLDCGEGWAELRCPFCDATWVGPIGEVCEYCRSQNENMRRWQAEIVLRPPEHDIDDPRRESAMRAWAGRLRRAVESGLTTKEQAYRAWRREVGREAA